MIRLVGWLRDVAAGRRLSWRSVSVVAAALTLAVAALAVDGFQTAKFDLDEAGVWATNAGRQVAGRINTQIAQVEVVSAVVSSRVDVVQRGRQVAVIDPGKRVIAIDAATGNPAGTVDLPADVEVAAGGGKMAFLSRAGGRVWIAPFDAMGSVNLKKRKGSEVAPKDSVVAIGPSGAVFTVSASDREISYRGGAAVEDRSPIELELDGQELQFVVVGATPVVLSPSTGKVQIGTRIVDLARFGSGPVLQDGPADGSEVLVATDSMLVALSINDGAPTVLDEHGSGAPVRPVRVGPCNYGAWKGADSAAPRESLRCGRGPLQSIKPDFASGSDIRFRVNGPNVLLNQLEDGTAIVVRDGTFVTVNNWEDAIPKEDPIETEDPNQPTDGGDLDCSASQENTAPVPQPDPALGARPGVATVLKVLANDRDADCDVLAIDAVSDISPPGQATIVPVDRGHAVQFQSGPEVIGAITFTYTVSDGRSEPQGTTATVNVKAFAAENAAPTQDRPAKTSVARGQAVSFNVLESFSDPDGDALVLQSGALSAGAVGTLRTQSDGTVTFVDAGSQSGFEIDVQVSDGQAGAAGKLQVELAEDAKPVARNDHAVGLVGQPITVDVLANDAGVTGDQLKLAAVGESPADTSVVADTTAGLVIFTAASPGSYRVSYKIASGGKEADGWIRLDVGAPVANQAPIAVRDIVSVVVGGSVTVDLVANDSDVNLDVLVVQSVKVPPGTGVGAVLLEHRAVRVTATRPQPQPVMIDYWLTDGRSEPVVGQLIVQVVTTGRVNQPPTAKDDVAVVRVGDIVTVPVLANDLDPDGDSLKVAPTVTTNEAKGEPPAGVAFVAGTTVRFLAGAIPGSTSISYEVTDGISGSASALIRVTIIAAGANQAPVPRSIDARTLAEVPIQITVPTFGIDPDGDTVVLSLTRQPQLGTAKLVEGCDCFAYASAPGSVGTDSFTYTATDPSGQVGTATIRVGIAPRSSLNQPPTAGDDKVLVRPGGRVSVPVLANDADPDGDAVELVDEPIESRDGVSAEVLGDRVQVTATNATTATLAYQVTDGKESSTGYLTVEVTPQAPPVPPVARDDVAPVPKDRSDTVDVVVLANDEDPDGSVDELTVEVDPSATAVASVKGRRLEVKLSDAARLVLYKITDADGLIARAVVRVPASNVNLPPRLKGGLKPVVVDGGTTVDLRLPDLVEDPEGAKVLLMPGDGVTAVKGAATADGPELIKFTAEADYTGPGSVSFVVTDGAGPTDPNGTRATITLAVEIKSARNTPPVFTGASATVEVSGDATRINLVPFVNDPDAGDLDKLKFADLSGAASGIKASLDGTSLVITADKTAQKGSTIILSVTVTDGSNPPVAGAVQVQIVGSRKPLAKANDDAAEAVSDKETVVDVLANDETPPGLDPLTIVTADLDAALGRARVVDGKKVAITPLKEFVGVGTITYSVNDALADPDRLVTGKIRVSVKDRPGKAQPPTVAEFGNRYVVLTWQQPDARAGVIDKYEVSSFDGAIKKECPTTTCKIDASNGLVNGTTYKFRVRAHNEIDWAEPSEPSVDVTPDQRPNAATVGPALAYSPALASGQLQISWPAAAASGQWTNEGTPVQQYQVELSPAPTSVAQLTVPATTTSFVITGLSDGVEYTARVRARNDAKAQNDGWSEWSPTGNRESPASKPTSPNAVTAARVDDPVVSVINVKWAKPAAINAKELTGYTILVTENSVTTRVAYIGSAAAATFSQDVQARTGSTYTFQVVATNKAGDSPPSAATTSITGFTKPSPIGPVSAVATARNGEVQLNFAPPPANGDPIDTYRVTATPGGAQFLNYSGSGILVSGLTNGTPYTFAVAACNQGQNLRYCGDPVTSNSANPYGPPPAPSVDAQRGPGTTINLSWCIDPNGNGRPIDYVDVNIDGAWQRAPSLCGTISRDTGYSQTHSIFAHAVSSGLTGPDSPTRSATSPPPPWTNQVGKAQGGPNTIADGTCPLGKCSKIIAQLRDWQPGSTHQVTSTWGGGDWCTNYGPAMRIVTVDGNGNADVDTGCFAGNTNVGIIVDGNEYVYGWVNWAR